ncbi:MAG: transposase, partial [Caldilinea sp.]|uniref:transposase n=1 Tax=Caldilinea sp. TaxID=2293560 RepID=UPI0030AF775A
GVGASVSGWELCSRQKRGDGVGKTKVGKGSKVMVVVEGNGLPIGLDVDSAQPHELTLAERTLQTISVPRRRGRLRTRPQALVADKAYDSADFRRRLRRRADDSHL